MAARPYLPEDPVGSDKLRIINDLYEYIYATYMQVLYVKSSLHPTPTYVFHTYFSDRLEVHTLLYELLCFFLLSGIWNFDCL